MKAIQILEVIEEQEKIHLWLDDGSGYPKSYIKEARIELEKIQKDNQKLKILFDSEFCRCLKCNEYKRNGFGCYCENNDEK